MSFLGPQWLANLIPLISLLLSIILLVMFSELVNKKLIFPIAGMIKERTKTISHLLANSLAALVFIVYCYLGSSLLAKYIIQPVLQRLQNVILIVVIVLFFLFVYIFNTYRLRKKYIK
jgi:membrane protein DedA with SNARE-associated domain